MVQFLNSLTQNSMSFIPYEGVIKVLHDLKKHLCNNTQKRMFIYHKMLFKKQSYFTYTTVQNEL